MRMYIDPGTGSMLFSIIIGLATTAVFVFADQKPCVCIIRSHLQVYDFETKRGVYGITMPIGG